MLSYPETLIREVINPVILNSRNGTLVNGVLVQTVELKHGDEIRGGKTAILVTVADRLPAATLDRDWSEFATRPEAFQPVMLAPEGPIIPGYRLTEPLGSGAMGVVYHALREADGIDVAVKVISTADPSDPMEVRRFLREEMLMERLKHPNVVSYLASGVEGRLMYFVMEYIEGIDAGRLVGQEGPLPVKRAVRLLLSTLLGLDHAHGQGVVHRDVKPSNLLVTQTGGRERVKVVDFGLARAYQASALSGLTMTGTAAGTPHYTGQSHVN